MPTVYQIHKLKLYILIAAASLVFILVSGNIYTYVFTKTISVNKEDYILKNGYPVFTSENAYMQFVRNYPYETGATLTVHDVMPNETIWTIKKRFGITVQTLISANPHLKNLDIRTIKQLVIPSSNGSIIFFDSFSDLKKIIKKNESKVSNDILSVYRSGIFRLFSPHDVRMVFISDIKPVVVNDDISKLYSYMNYFSNPLENGYYTSMFGERVNPFLEGMEFHNGLDIAAPMRTEIRAAKEGMVFFTGWKGGFGNTVIIQHADGYTSLYGHCSKILVDTGEWIKKDQPVALVGSTGRSTGPHLHYTIFRHGKAINPIDFVW